MSEISRYRDLVAWQKAFELSVAMYSVSAQFPKHEQFGLTSQLRRSAISVPSNIAEGYGRGRTQDYLRFLRMARGSLFELDTQLQLAHRLGYASDVAHETHQASLNECGRVLAGLIRSIEGKEGN